MDFPKVRRRAMLVLSDEALERMKGTSDSEVMYPRETTVAQASGNRRACNFSSMLPVCTTGVIHEVAEDTSFRLCTSID